MTWRENELEVLHVVKDQMYILLLAKVKNDDLIYMVENMYGPHVDSKKEALLAH